MWLIKSRVFRLKNDAEVAKDIPLKGGQEVEVVLDVVYINGNMVPPAYQPIFLKWVKDNPTLFDDVTKQW
jgi:hypothetical protein